MKYYFLFSLVFSLNSFTTLKAQNNSNAVYGFGAGDHMQNAENNTYIGSLSGGINYNGDANVFIGYSSGYESENGSNNTYLGSFSGHNCTGSDNVFIGYRSGMNETGNNKLYIENSNSSNPLIWGDFTSDLLKLNGKVGIGSGFGNFPTTAGGVNLNTYNLFVKGGILTEEVRVNLQSAWADYVFRPEYKLPTLTEVEKHIQDKGHLINVPSATQIAVEGIALGEMAKIQQEKIEELTLYILQQNKINTIQNERLEQQSKEIDDLKKLVQSLIEKK